MSPADNDRAPIDVATAGPRFATVTVNVWAAVSPPGSAAVTVTSALPPDSAASSSADPSTAAVTTIESVHATVYVSASPSGSLK